MTLAASPEPAPLRTDEHGVVRVGGTRVTLDQVVYPFLEEGVTPEEIAMRYSTLELADVYAAIAYYLRHREQVDEYLAGQRRAAQEARSEFGEVLDVSELRSRLLTRQRV
jgi:uncharacterized protein (DUF433 family)